MTRLRLKNFIFYAAIVLLVSNTLIGSASNEAELDQPPLKVRRTEKVQHATAAQLPPQVNGIATNDALFKGLLNEDSIQPSFFRAFKRSKIKEQPSEVLANNEAEYERYERYSQFTAEQVAKGKAEGETAKAIEIARGMLKDKMSTATIAKYTGLTADEITAKN